MKKVADGPENRTLLACGHSVLGLALFDILLTDRKIYVAHLDAWESWEDHVCLVHILSGEMKILTVLTRSLRLQHCVAGRGRF